MKEIKPGRFGEVMAHLQHFGQEHRAEVLAKLGIGETAYAEAERTVPTRAAQCSAHDDSAALEAIATGFARAKLELEQSRPTLESLGALEPPTKPAFGGAALRTPPRVVPADPNADETVAPVSHAANADLPFERAQARMPPPISARQNDPLDNSGETVVLGHHGEPSQVTPFDRAAFPGWSVERYANFVADRRTLGVEAARRIHRLYDADTEQRLTTHFNAVFARDGTLRAHMLQLIVARTAAARDDDSK